MFASGTSGKAKAINAIALLAIVTAGAIIALAFMKFKQDPKGSTGDLRAVLPFGKHADPKTT